MGGDSSTDPIDSVEYDTNAGWDFVTDDGFSYELVAKGFDNDVGANWAQSCTVFGTPGSDPSATCTAGCSVNGCGAGNSCSNDAAMCVCDAAMSYYPRCTSSTSCTKCATLYPPDSCTATWRKNGTYRYAVYEWEANENVVMASFFTNLRTFRVLEEVMEYRRRGPPTSIRLLFPRNSLKPSMSRAISGTKT